MNIQIFGDSIMQGVIYSADTGRYTLRKDRFKALADSGITVTNNARMGATIDKGMSSLERKLGRCGADTLVLFEFGGNDCDYDWAKVSDAPTGTHNPHTVPEKFILTYKSAIETAKAKGAKVAIANLIPIDAVKYMSFISKGRSYANILAWLGDVSMLARWQEYYNSLVEKIASETGAMLIDIRNAFLTTHDYANCLSADGIHPTEEGYSIMENAMAKALLA